MDKTEERTVLVTGIDVANDRFEGQIYMIGPGMRMARLGHAPMFVGVIDFSSRALEVAASSQGACCIPVSDRPWLRRKKGGAS